MAASETEVQKLKTQLVQVAEEYQFLEQQQNELINHMTGSHETVKELSQLVADIFDSFNDIESKKQKIIQQLKDIKNALEPILFTELGDKQVQVNRAREAAGESLKKAQIVLQTLTQYRELQKSNISNQGSQVQEANEQFYREIAKILDKNNVEYQEITSTADIIMIIQQLLKYREETQTLMEAGENLKTALEEQLQCQNNNHLIIQDLNANIIQQETAIQILENEKEELLEQIKERDELIKRLQNGHH